MLHRGKVGRPTRSSVGHLALGGRILDGRIQGCQKRGRVGQQVPYARRDQRLEVRGRDALPDAVARRAVEQRSGDVVAIADACLQRVRRGEALAGRVVPEPGQQANVALG